MTVYVVIGLRESDWEDPGAEELVSIHATEASAKAEEARLEALNKEKKVWLDGTHIDQALPDHFHDLYDWYEVRPVEVRP